MNTPYSTPRVTLYCQKLAKVLTEKHFHKAGYINGPQLPGFSPVRQLNLFIIKELLGQWQHEAMRLKSPYFDFEAQAVKNSLQQFMNVLSQHIQINRQHFEPLLKTAAENTLLLALDPVAYFEKEFIQTEPEADIARLRSYLRYLDFDRLLFTEFLESVQEPVVERKALLHRFELYATAHYKSQQPASTLIDQLSALEPLQLSDLQELRPAQPNTPAPTATAEPAKPAPVPAQPVPVAGNPVSAQVKTTPQQPVPTTTAQLPKQPAPAQLNSETLKTPQPAETVVNKTTLTEVPTPTPAPVQSTQPNPAKNTTAAPSVAAKSVTNAESAGSAEEASGRNDRFKADKKPSLNDKLRTGAPTLAETIGEKKIETLKSSISINQRFSFINELFGGDNQAYHAAIDELDRQPDLESARAFVQDDLTNAYGWTNHTEHVAKLMRLVERKFS